MSESAHVSNDSTVDQETRPRPLFGLPQSLLRQEGRNLAIFAVLQPMGLNRKLKHKLLAASRDKNSTKVALTIVSPACRNKTGFFCASGKTPLLG